MNWRKKKPNTKTSCLTALTFIQKSNVKNSLQIGNLSSLQTYLSSKVTQPLNILTSRHGNSCCYGRRRTGFHGGTRREEQTMSLERFCPQTGIWTLEWQLVVGRHRSLVKMKSDHHIVRKSLKKVPQSKQLIQSGMVFLTLYTRTSVCIFSILFSIHFLRSWKGEFV